MRTPPLLMGGALLFWGWENGFLLWAALLAIVLEGSRFSRLRWELSNVDLNRIADLCWVLFVGAMLLLYSTEDRIVFIFRFAQWLPFVFFPLMLAQAYGNRDTMPLSSFWWRLRRSPASPAARKSYNISFGYFAFCLLAASASTRADSYFYAGVTVLVALALTSARPRRISIYAWVALLAVAATAGQFSHQELRRMQSEMEGALGAWFADLFRQPTDVRECPTMIGHPGQIALSGKIAMRVRAEPGGYVPGLLREATWDAYKKESWLASNNDLTPVHMANGETARFLPTNAFSSEIEIARYFDGGSGLMALPHGTIQIDDVYAGTISTNRLGTIAIAEAARACSMCGPRLAPAPPWTDRPAAGI